MSTLSSSRFVTEVAFAWNSNARIFECDDMIVSAEYDIERWKTGANKNKIYVSGLYLSFSLNFRFLRLIRSESGSNNDVVDVLNNLYDDSVSVLLRPVNDVDATEKYEVVPRRDAVETVHIRRFTNIPEYAIDLVTVDLLSSLPAWMNNTNLVPDPNKY